MRKNATEDERTGFAWYVREGILRPAPYPTLFVLSLLVFFASIIGGVAFFAAGHEGLPSPSLNVLAEAEFHYRAGDLMSARTEFAEASALAPGNSNYLVSLGVTENALGEKAEAMDAFKRALRVQPDQADANYYLGLLYLQSNETEAAIQHISRSISVRPTETTAELFNDLGVAYRRNGQPDKAAASFVRALEINPELTSAQQNLAKLRGRSP